ncbi:hypothetical protein ABZ023_18600 [Streptomyces sp. NPDC006367]|uniref:hypothetical protein n=1 Tax=unclassified Streptomyces TaxID=2593676 RepID=UPI0033B743D2
MSNTLGRLDLTPIKAAIDLAETYDQDGAPLSARRNLLHARTLLDRIVRSTGAVPKNFFVPDSTYVLGDGFTAPEDTRYFRVEHVMRHPDRGIWRAVGWERTGRPEAPWHGDFHDEDEFEDWTLLRHHDACACVTHCDQDPATACSLSGIRHVHPAVPGRPGAYGPCPDHPDAPGDH